MGFWRWMTKPHFPPLSLVGIYAGVFAMGWFHAWAMFGGLVVVSFVGEYFFTEKARRGAKQSP
jgi:hypothetical protein